MLRYEILAEFGGVYVDVDFECKRNIESLIAGESCFVARQSDHLINNAIIGATAGHPFLEDLIISLPNQFSALPEDAPSVKQSGPFFFTTVVARHPDVRIFSPELFYPYQWHERWRRNEDFPQAFAVHHWTLSGRIANFPKPRIHGNGESPSAAVFVIASSGCDSKRLRWVLEGLCLQTVSDFEVYLIDPYGRDGIRATGKLLSGRLQLDVLGPDDWRLGSSSSALLCDLALAKTRAPRVILLDGPCVPDLTFVETHALFGQETVAPFGFRRIYPHEKFYEFVSPLDYEGLAIHSHDDPRRTLDGSQIFGDWRDVEGYSLSAPTASLSAVGFRGSRYALEFRPLAHDLLLSGNRLRPLWGEAYVTYLA